MANESVVVVGDRFDEFATNRKGVPVSVLLWRLRTGDLPDSLSVLVGQGLSAEQRAALEELVDRHRDKVSFLAAVPSHVDRGATHKRDPRNVLIGVPERVGDDEFVADLVVDEGTETLADHLTGQHIPAIALMEAARQTWTAVTERYFLNGETRTRFVINDVRSSFHSFVFPLPAVLRYRLLAHEKSPVQEEFRCLITVHQGDGPVAEVEASYRVIPEVLSAKQEAMAARQALRRHLSRLEEVPASPARKTA